VNLPDRTYSDHRPAPGNPQVKGRNELVLLQIRKPQFAGHKPLQTGKNEPLRLRMTIRIYTVCMPENRVNAK
jgi:hypothetical protein